MTEYNKTSRFLNLYVRKTLIYQAFLIRMIWRQKEMFNLEEYKEVLEVLSESGSFKKVELLQMLDAELSLPNIPFPTMGEEVFWTDIAKYGGWKIQ